MAIRRRRDHPAPRPSREREHGRSGAAATAARTASSASPRTLTPTPCPSRSGTAASICSPTRAPTAITASRLAVVLPLHRRAQHGRSGRSESVRRRRLFPLGSACKRPRVKVVDTATWPGGPLSTMATWPSRSRSAIISFGAAWTGRLGSIDIVDRIDGGPCHQVRLAFHLGPEVHVELGAGTRHCVEHDAVTPGQARLEMPPATPMEPAPWRDRSHSRLVFTWAGRQIQAFSLVGEGTSEPGAPLATRLEFVETGASANAVVGQRAISWDSSDVGPGPRSGLQAEAR